MDQCKCNSNDSKQIYAIILYFSIGNTNLVLSDINIVYSAKQKELTVKLISNSCVNTDKTIE